MSVGEAHDARRVLQQALVVRGEDEGQAEAAIEVAHQVDELRGIVGVEVGSGFVGQHQRWTMHDGARHGYALALAAAEQVRTLVGALGKTRRFRAPRPPALLRSRALTCWTSSGYSTFSAAVKTGIRLKV